MIDDAQALLGKALEWVRGGGLVRVSRHELFIPSLVLLIGTTLLYWPLFKQVYKTWNEDDNYSHIILVPFLIIWQLVRRKDTFRPEDRRVDLRALVLLAPLLAMQFVAFMGDFWAVHSVSIVCAIFGATWLFFGFKWAWAAKFPILFLFFMLPAMGSMLEQNTNELQIASTTVAEKLLGLAGQNPMRLSPVTIQLNSYALDIAIPCSGLKLLVAVTCFTCHFILYARMKMNFNFSMLILVVPLCLLMNGLRIAMIGLVGENFGAPAGAAFHDYSGYIMLLICFFIIFKFARLLGWRD